MTKQQTDDTGQQKNTLGDLLYNTRKEQQKTLAEAAAATRINAFFLQALEKNDYGALPAEVFIRGFIKLYAAYLGLNPDDTLNHYLNRHEITVDRPPAAPYPDDIIDTELLDKTSLFKTQKSRKGLPVLILLAILTLFYVLGILFKSGEQIPDLSPVADLTTTILDTAALPTQTESVPTPAPTTPEPNVPPAESAKPAVKATPARAVVVEPPARTEPVTPPPPVVTRQEASPPSPVAAAAQPPKAIVPAAGTGDGAEAMPRATLPVTVRVATEGNQAAPSADSSGMNFKYVLEARFEEGSMARIKIDDRPQLQYNYNAGIIMRWQANDHIVLELDNRPGVILTLNGRPLPSGDSTESTATINIPADLPNDTQF